MSRRDSQSLAGVRLTGTLAAWVLRGLGATWRVRNLGEDPFREGRPIVAATWHRGMLPAACPHRNRGAAVPVSRSRDGELVATSLCAWASAPRREAPAPEARSRS